MTDELTGRHRTVMRTEAVEALALTPTSTVVDATLGGGGHTEAILERLGEGGTLIALDVDGDAVARAEARIAQKTNGERGVHTPTVHIVEANFRDISLALAKLKVSEVNAILADLGWSSEQFEGGGRGLSFKYPDEPLHMTLGAPEKYLFTARDIVMGWGEEDIANVLFGYGEERYARRIARAIVEHRTKHPIETVGALVSVIEAAVPAGYRHGRLHPATKSFQGLRIAVNDELAALREFILGAVESLASKGRLAIITFHSVEDRIVKQTFKEYAAEGKGTVLTKKPLAPSREETTRNPRARSAKLRIFQKD